MNAGEIPTTNQYIAINMPPRHSKSMTITETLPSYYLGNFPEERVIEISYSDTFARRFGKKNKEKVKQYNQIYLISKYLKKARHMMNGYWIMK